MTRFSREETWTPAGALKPGDRIVLSSNRNLSWTGKGTEEEGFLLGLLLGDGTLKTEGGVISVWGEDENAATLMKAAGEAAGTLPHRIDFRGFQTMDSGRREHRMRMSSLRDLAADFGMFPGHKKVSPLLEQTSSMFHEGFLRGLFDSDGKVAGSQEKGVSVRLLQHDIPVLCTVQNMLHRLGIASTVYADRKDACMKSMPDGKGGNACYETTAGHELIISGENLKIFSDRIGFGSIGKQKQLDALLADYKRSLNRERFVATVTGINPCGFEDVYDVQIPEINAFDANGIMVHNCGEQPLLPFEACNLGSINLSLLVLKTAGKAEVDYPRLTRIVRTAVHFLDNVIDVNKYPLPDIDKMTRGTRKIGLGVMGWADMLLQLGIPYDSDEAEALARKVMGHVQDASHAASVKLAQEKGVFPFWQDSIYKAQGIALRNATTTTIAPTGTLSMIAGVSSGVEPMFAIAYIKNVMDGTELFETNPYFRQAAEEGGFYSEGLMKRVVAAGTLHGMDDVPEPIRRLYVTAHDISPEWHVRMQAAFQAFTDNAVSKTVNLSHEATEDDVREVFIQAYRTGCKGVTIYRDGSRGLQVLNIGSVNAEKKAESTGMAAAGASGAAKAVKAAGSLPPAAGRATGSIGASAPDAPVQPVAAENAGVGNAVPNYGHIAPRPRPEITTGFTEKVKIGCGNLYITVNYDENGICEVFTNTGRAGGCPSQSEATSRLVSIALRSGMDEKAIVEQLKGIRCPSTIRQKGLKVLSCPDAIGRLIEKVSNHRNGNGSVHAEIAAPAAQRFIRPMPDLVRPQEEDVPDGKTRSAGVPADNVSVGMPSANAPAGASALSWGRAAGSPADARARIALMEEDEDLQGNFSHDCPECGEVMEHEGGCRICRSCGYSKCG
jgi:ribonucleoside-diphosphate reductase alpha chain